MGTVVLKAIPHAEHKEKASETKLNELKVMIRADYQDMRLYIV